MQWLNNGVHNLVHCPIVLGTFDGISCGQVALQRAGITYDKYYASEIDKNAITITQKNWPDTIQLGDITKWRDWDIEKIDLIIGGSPCQGFSSAGRQLNFDDPRSKLFFEFVDIIHHYKPKYWLLENVVMKDEIRDAISDYLGVQPIFINSSLVSAQNRKRYYWTNIPNIVPPKDKGIRLSDILENDEYSYPASITGRRLKDGVRKDYDKSVPITQCLQVRKDSDIVPCLTTVSKDAVVSKLPHGRYAGAYDTSMREQWRDFTNLECERLQTLPDGYTEGISETQRRKAIGNGWTVDVIAHILRGI